jgi:hypothetical protein
MVADAVPAARYKVESDGAGGDQGSSEQRGKSAKSQASTTLEISNRGWGSVFGTSTPAHLL